MTDLRTLLDQSTTAPAPVTRSVVEADVARGRRELRRRLVLRGTRSGVLLVAASGALVFAAQGGLLTGPAQAPAPRPSTSQHVGATALVAYTGAQPVGFTLDRVPAGWVVEAVDTGALTLVPVGQADPARYADLAAKGVRDLQGRIAATRGDLPQGTSGTTVRVAGTTGLVAATDLHGDADHLGGRTLFIKQPSGTYLAIQVPQGLGWSDQQLVEFGAGVHLTDDAGTTRG